MTWACCCDPVAGAPSSSGGSASATNIGSGEEVYVTGTSSPFEFRTLTSDGSVTIVENADEIELSVASMVPLTNIGSGDGIYSGAPNQLKSLVAGANITLTPSGTEIEIAATGGSGLPTTFQQTGTLSFTNSATAYATAWTSAATTIGNGETWDINCEWLTSNYSPSAVSSVRNRWQIETSAGVWSTLEDNLCSNEGQSLGGGDLGSPRSRVYRITATMATPRLRLQAGMNLFVGGSGLTQNPRITGIRVA